ncbi:integral membrane protein [Xylariaceae sp. FL0016]|nr:integral membrane protein [Xylariaceae sp. FL0016]
MRTPTLEVLQSWPKPNYVDPETRGPVGKIVGSILITLATAILAIRLYARKKITRGFGLDDTLIFCAYVPATVFVISGLIAEEKLQWNRHIWDVEPKFFVPDLKFGLVTLILFDVATGLTKLSMLAMIYRLTSASHAKAKSRTVLVLAVIIGIDSFVFIIVEIFQCRPISSYWEISAEPKHCIDEGAHLAAANLINTITDFIIVLLPISTIMGLELPTKQRIIVSCLLCTGLLACGAGIARTYFQFQLSHSSDFDTTWDAWAVWFCSAIELYLGIICASVPATKPFFASFLPNLIGTTLASKPRDSKAIAWDSKPPRSTIYTTPNKSFERPQSSPSSFTSSLREVADLNKPLPPIAPPIATPKVSRFSEASTMTTMTGVAHPLSLHPVSGIEITETRPLFSPQRAGVRFSDRSTFGPLSGGSNPQDRTTVIIAYQADNDPGRMV